MFKASATPEEVASWVEQEFNAARTARLSIERQWLLNLAFYYGKQWVTWGPRAINGTASRLIEPKVPKWRVRMTVNKIEPYVRREQARLSSNRPRGFVMPATPDEADKSAARAAEQLAEFLQEEAKLEEVMDLCDWWTCICGPGFIKTRFVEEWDPINEMMGKIKVEALRPFDIYVPNIEETRVEEQAWVMHVSSLTKSQVKETWGEDVELNPEVSEVDQQVRQRMGIFTARTEDRVIVKEVWIKPCRNFPDGLVATVANGKLMPLETPVEIDEETGLPVEEATRQTPEGTIVWPFAHKKYPFVRRGHTMSGKFYDSSFVWTLISLQREYNVSRSQMIENRNLTSRPQWAIVEGSVDPAMLTTEPGAYIPYNLAFPAPQQIVAPNMPAYTMNHIEMTAREMDEIASQNEVSKGTVPPNVEAATAIAYLQERDDSAVSYAIRSRERAYAEVTRQMLSLVQQYWDAGRIVRVVGDNSNYDAFTLKGADLKGNTDYRVVVGSGQTQSRAAQKAEIMELLKGGAIPISKGLRAMNMPDMATLIAEMEINEIQANKENLRMSRGEFAMVEDFHDHVAHINEHDDFRKREEFQGLNPMIKAMFRFHTYIHMEQLGRMFNMVPMSSDGMTPLAPQQPPVDPMTGQPQPFFVDPAMEFEYRKIFMQLQAGVGVGAPSTEEGIE